MKERPASEVEAGCGAASAALRCVGLRSATAALRSNCSSVSGTKGLQKSIGKSAAEWHFTLGERYTLARRTFPPREATQMSHGVKYIGMDVHKEAIVIAVLDGSGKLVMETVVETKAISILQFIHGLRGELHVTWEEGTWASWLYDLLQPQVQEVLVCNQRRNALCECADRFSAAVFAPWLRANVDLAGVSPGSYFLGLRQPGLEWTRFPMRVL